MHLVAIHHLSSGAAERAAELGQLLGVTAYEARPRLLAQGGGPAVVASFAEAAKAAELAAALDAAGFAAFVFDSEALAAAVPLVVRGFTLAPEALQVEATGSSLSIPYPEIRLLVRGSGIIRSVTTEKVSDKRFDVGRAVLSGGLALTKTTHRTITHTSEERRHFLQLHADGRPALIFNETELLYDGLGAARQPTRQANFLALIAELRRRCPAARFDERLLNRAGQAQLLGPALAPEEHLLLATALLARSLGSA